MGRDKEADKAESTRVARSSFLMMIASGAVLGAICLAGAPLFIRILLGAGFEPAAPVLRMFALVLMLDAIGIALGVQWMLPLGLDKQFTAIVVVAGITNVILAPLLARPYGHTGMALAVIASETVVAGGCFIYLRLRKLDPFSLERLPDSAKMEVAQL